MANRSKNCSDGSPSSSSYMRRKADTYPFPEDPIKPDPSVPPEYKADIRSVQERYRDYRKSVGDDQQYRFEEEDE
jgi:hypothetical protein